MRGWQTATIIILGIVAVLCVLVLIPLVFRIMGHVDVLHNRTYFSVRVFGQRIYSAAVRVAGNRLYIIPKSGKEHAFKIVAPKEDEDAIASYIPPKLPHINFYKLNFYCQIGKSDDAFFSAMMLAAVQAVTLATAAVMKAKHPSVKIDTDFETAYNIDHLQGTFNCILSLNIANIIYAVVSSARYHKRVTLGRSGKKRAKTANR